MFDSDSETELPIGKRIQEHRQNNGLTQEQLATLSGVPYTTLTKIEAGRIKNPSLKAISKLAKALHASLDDLLLTETFRGKDTLKRIHEDILNTLEAGDTMYITGVDEERFLAADKKQIRRFIKNIGKSGLKQQLLSCEGDAVGYIESYVSYKWVPKQFFNPNPIYVYGDKVAAIVWGPPQQAVIVNNPIFADAYRKQFLFMWENAITPKKRKKV